MLTNTIKEATKQAHLDLERKVVKQLKAISDENDYAELLKVFYAYFNRVEQAIAPYITTDVLPDYKDRRNSSYLKKDIEELGQNVDELPVVTSLPITNTLQALGALYVMEGSIMGGSIIVQMLAKLGITKGVSFFSGYGEETGAMWNSFTTVLNNKAKSASDEAIAIQAANDTFNGFSVAFGEASAL